MRQAAILALALAATASLPDAGQAAAPQRPLTSAQSDYLEQCGGCHGLQGDSRPSPIPVLRGRVGWFMCTEEGRAYLGRLPNVAYAPVENDDLAQMMNFVVFGLGGGTAPPHARPFEGPEMGRLRAQPMTGGQVEQTRKAVVETLVRKCGAPASLREAYDIKEASTHR